MADIRFKISGTSQPFLAQVINGSGTLINQSVINYSGSTCGSCNILSSLDYNTSYSLKITDYIGNTVTEAFTTPAAIGTTTLVSKSISLGTPVKSTITDGCVISGVVVVNPALSAGETYTIILGACAVGGSSFNANSTITISCKPNGSQTYVTKCTHTNNLSQALDIISMNYGDSLCYNLSSVGITGGLTMCGCSVLDLICVTSSNFNPTYSLESQCASIYCNAVTTTVIPTLSLVSVYLTNTEDLSSGYVGCGRAKLVTSPPLTTGQSFRLCYKSSGLVSTEDGTGHSISACAFLCNTSTSTCSNFVNAAITSTINPKACTLSCNSYVNITSDNINDLVFYTVARSAYANNGCQYTDEATSCIYAISNGCGGNFVLGSVQNIKASIDIDKCCGVFASNV